MKEPILEPFLRKLRIRRVLPYIRQHRNCRLLDIGCGWDAKFLKSVEPYIHSGVGIDFKAPEITEGKIHTDRLTLLNSLPYTDASFDIVTMLAVLEHLEHPKAILCEIHRVLRPGGQLVLTVPSRVAKPVLEFLAFRLGVVSRVEIADHKVYYDRNSLGQLIQGSGFSLRSHIYFQLGMKNFCVAER
jgi:ubiquinone/menaquinone biosynthesis C-methylase UbiE